MDNLLQSIAGFPDFLLYFVLALALLAIFVAIYVRVTPYREIALIREGNIAASISLSGAVVGLVLPLASAIAHSVNALDMAAWGVIATSRLVPRFREAIEAGRAAPAVLLAAISISAGVLNAASMSY
jgi:putative membrane protein